MLRSLLLNNLVALDDPVVLATARDQFAACLAGTAQIPADLRNAVYAAAVKEGGEDVFEQALQVIVA